MQKLLQFSAIALFILATVVPMQAKAATVEILIFKQLTNPNSNRQYDFTSKRQQQLQQKMRNGINQTSQVFGGSELLRLTAARTRLQNAGHQILFTQKLQLAQLPENQTETIAIADSNESLNGIVHFTRQGIVKSDFFLRFRPAGRIANDTDPAYFIEQQLRLVPSNIYYMDNSQYGVIVGIWAD